MNGKTRDWLWIIVGGYLTYTGVQLVMDVLNQKPEGYIGFVIAGVLFAVFGVGLIVYSIRNMTKPVDEQEIISDGDAQQEDAPAAERQSPEESAQEQPEDVEESGE